jgi:hypothetical protein
MRIWKANAFVIQKAAIHLLKKLTQKFLLLETKAQEMKKKRT